MKLRKENRGMQISNRWLLFFIFTAFFSLWSMPSKSFAAGNEWVDVLAKVPVQQGGRVKPFESFAREALLYVTGRTAWEKKTAVEIAWEWIAAPEKWAAIPLIYVGPQPIRDEFGLKLIGKRVSSEVALSEKSFVQKVQDAVHRRERREALSFTDKKRIEIYDRALFLTQLGSGELPGWIPESQNPRGAWLKFADFSVLKPAEWMKELPRAEMDVFKKAAENFAGVFRADSVEAGAKMDAAVFFQKSLEAVWSRAGMGVDQNLLSREIFYNRLHAFGRGSKLYLLAAFFFFVAFVTQRRRKQERDYPFWVGFAAYAAAILLHITGFYLRSAISGRAPVTNMYESIVWVSLAAAIFSLPIYFYLKNKAVLIIAALVAAVGLVIAESFPAVLDPALSPLTPVLRSNLWLTIHVLTITMSYGAFALAWGLGHVVVLGYAFRKNSDGLVSISNAVYRAIQIGVILLASGTVLGGVWANYSWGRFWGWDPKETWALIALLGYLVVLHGRFIGWFGSFGIALGAALAFMGVVMAWYGVNFVLAAGLHSYGFGGGGYGYVATAVITDLIIIGFAAWHYLKNLRLIQTKRGS